MTPGTTDAVDTPRKAPTRQNDRGGHSAVRVPRWLSRPPARTRKPPVPVAPNELRWWSGVVWLLLSALLLGFVGHVVVLGALQQARSQSQLYQELRSNLAQAIVPLGQLDGDSNPTPAGTPIALIQIPSLGISEVVVEGTTGDDLRMGPGHRRDTVLPGQQGTSVIFGRQAAYGGTFRDLGRLQPGDAITVTTGQGVGTFEVFGIRRAGDLLPTPLDSGQGRLELVTGDGPALAPTGALHVDATLTSEVRETPSRVFTSAVLAESELAMQPDADSGLPTLFWLQWLVVASIAVRWLLRTWGGAQAWIVGVPTLLALGAAAADSAIGMLPNLL
ncbi:sortase [Cryobacterium melibiosiphilum]|uniref:Sortase n=1 Tax=Cryobacterium melibiosiphilum TaxID=995039 RepID=A0A3A5MLF1_9MICO|nr:sortase [Cryobacterium melibiosiphilum]RJT86896.1 sortase [Cryobacterium melibiosiphilum]